MPTTLDANGKPIQTGLLSTTAKLPWDTTPAVAAPQPVATATPGLLGPTATADVTNVNPSAMSDEMARVTDPNSLLSQRSRAVANEISNSAGILNSSMAIGAAENAVLANALPVAQGNVDAQRANALAANTLAVSNAGERNAANTLQAQLATDVNKTNAAAQNAQIMAQLDQTNKVQLASLNAKYTDTLNASANSATLYNNAMSQISAVQNNPNLDAVAKTSAIAGIMTNLEGGLSMMSAISGLDLAAGLDFGAIHDASAQALGFANAEAQRIAVEQAVAKGVAKEKAATMTNTAIGAVLGGVTGGILGNKLGAKITNAGSAIGRATGLWS